MFSTGKETYKSDIKLGEKYRDEQTKIEGVATAVYFFQYACERVTLEMVVKEELKEYVFDAPRLVHIQSGVQATTEKTGGPSRGEGVRTVGQSIVSVPPRAPSRGHHGPL